MSRILFDRSEWQYRTGSASYRFPLAEGEKFLIEVRSSASVMVCLIDHDGVPMPIADGPQVAVSGAAIGYSELEVFPSDEKSDVFMLVRGVQAEAVLDETPVAVSHDTRPDPIKAQLRQVVSEYLSARGLSFADVIEDEEDEDDLSFGDEFDHWLDSETPYMEEDFPVADDDPANDDVQPEVVEPEVGASAPETSNIEGADAPDDEKGE